MAKTRPSPVARTQTPPPPRPQLADHGGRFLLLEREVEQEFRPQLLQALQDKVDHFQDPALEGAPSCPDCGQAMGHHDSRRVWWVTRFGRIYAQPRRYRCRRCGRERRPLLEILEVEPGQLSGSLARLVAVLAVVAPYTLAAQLVEVLLGVHLTAMGVWRATQRLGEAAARYTEALSQYHADDRSLGAPTQNAPGVVVVSVDGCMLGMQVRPQRRRRKGAEPLSPLPPIEGEGFREVKTGVVLLPSERVETSPGRHSLVRRFLVSCLGNGDAVFQRLYALLREQGFVGVHTVVVIVGDGAEWIWNRATMFVNRCEILDYWHALEHAWAFARIHYGEGSRRADRWVRQMGEDLRAGKVLEVIARLERLRPSTPQAQESLQKLIGYYREHAARMRYDEYLRLGYGIGSGAVESAHKQVVHARLRQAGMRWSEAGARRLLALRLLLLNSEWATLDRLRMVSLAA